MLAKVEATLVPPPRKCLRVIIDEDDEAEAKEKKEKALARRSPSMWPAILKMSASRLRTSTGHCGRSSDRPPRFWNAHYQRLPGPQADRLIRRPVVEGREPAGNVVPLRA
jgi:hypothetical protein